MTDKKSKHLDLLICVRCHKDLAFIMDTISSVEAYTDPDCTAVFAAVDCNPRLARRLRRSLGEDRVYCSSKRWWWGAGLYGLLVESIVWAEHRFSFSHFLTIDYDTLFIAPGGDLMLLNLVNDVGIGLVGQYNPTNFHWRRIFEREERIIKERFGHVPASYTPGEGVQGGCMLLTRALIDKMKRRGMFQGRFRDAKAHTSIADDHLLPLFCRMCGLEIVTSSGFTYCCWKITRDPRGLEKKGFKIFHPTKLRPNNKDHRSEMEIRNYFRRLRGLEVLK